MTSTGQVTTRDWAYAVLGDALLYAAIALLTLWAFTPADGSPCRVSCVDSARPGVTFWSHGSATLIAGNRVLTCWHTFNESHGPYFVTLPSGRYRAELIRTEPRAELALLSVPGATDQPTPTDWSEPELDAYYASGFGNGEQPGFRTVTGHLQPWEGERIDGVPIRVLAGAQVRQGDSGGGVVDQRGALRGVLWGVDGEGTHFVCGKVVADFLGEVAAERQTVVASLPTTGQMTTRGYQTANFLVVANAQSLAQEIGDAAEYWRAKHALEWFGEQMPNWSERCPIRADVSPTFSSGGSTNFFFNQGEVVEWRMNIQGNRERILDSVVPHEVLHTVFASYFRQPIPRWADEGACTAMEHEAERGKHNRMLIGFLKTKRAMPLSVMMSLSEYPPDQMPLYAQGYSVTRWLIDRYGREKFLAFVEASCDAREWTDYTKLVKEHFGYEGCQPMQDAWLEWVKKGSPIQYECGYGPQPCRWVWNGMQLVKQCIPQVTNPSNGVAVLPWRDGVEKKLQTFDERIGQVENAPQAAPASAPPIQPAQPALEPVEPPINYQAQIDELREALASYAEASGPISPAVPPLDPTSPIGSAAGGLLSGALGTGWLDLLTGGLLVGSGVGAPFALWKLGGLAAGALGALLRKKVKQVAAPGGGGAGLQTF
jgi:hypothetical protein